MLEWVAHVNGRFSCSDGALVPCTCGIKYWVGWNNCPQCGKSQLELKNEVSNW